MIEIKQKRYFTLFYSNIVCNNMPNSNITKWGCFMDDLNVHVLEILQILQIFAQLLAQARKSKKENAIVIIALKMNMSGLNPKKKEKK